MVFPDEVIDLEKETAFLGALIEQNAPGREIEAEADLQCRRYLGFTRTELTEQVPQSVLGGLDDWAYEEIIWLGLRHGFDFCHKADTSELPPDFDGGCVIDQWVYFAEVLIAKECGFFPTDPADLARIKLDREAAKFQDVLRRQKQRPRTDHLEREKVFGPTINIKPGVIIAPKAKGKDARGQREVRVEVLPRRGRSSPPSSRR